MIQVLEYKKGILCQNIKNITLYRWRSAYTPLLKTRLFKYIKNFTTKKMKNFQIKNSGSFHVYVQNKDCGYFLEPPRRGGSIEYPQSMFLSRNKKINV